MKMLKDEEFEEFVKEGVTLIDFYADWCGPCRMVAPIFEQVSKEMDDKAKFGKVNTDQCQKVASAHRITSIPTMILFKDGKEVKRVVGVQGAKELTTLVNSAL